MAIMTPVVQPLACTLTQAGAGGQSLDSAIRALFASGEKGVWYDPSDLSSMFQDSAGTTPAVVDQAVGYIADKSGNGNHAKQSITASKPILRLSGGLYYLQFDGVDDFLVTGNIDFTATDKMTVVAGVRKLSEAAAGAAVGVGANINTTTSVELTVGPNTNKSIAYGSRGTALAYTVYTNDAIAVPVSMVLTGQSEITTDTCTLRLNGVQVVTSASDQGTGNYGSAAIYIGRRGGTLLPFNGNLNQLIVRGAATTLVDVQAGEKFVAGKTGVTLP
ncbi:MAG: hypothetical protein JSS57_22110 [Proteobacteria bacterium]|nr:hypothetical protein [Pseudomonadota bacterium]